jgi:hypothetical protein
VPPKFPVDGRSPTNVTGPVPIKPITGPCMGNIYGFGVITSISVPSSSSRRVFSVLSMLIGNPVAETRVW